jgi:hypothetical protein
MTVSLKNFPDYKTVATDLLIPYARNSRTHSAEQIAQIAASIKEFGFLNPIIIDGENGIIAGHGRVMAAQKLGIDELPCVEAKHLTEAQRKAYVIADNKLALNAGWDDNLLKIELNELSEINFDLKIIGFEPDEIKELLFDQEKEKDDESPYSQKVDAPVYQVTGEKPSIENLYDDSKAMGMIEDIKNSNLPENEKNFLMAAASRHIEFNFELIAEYYAHSSKECQELMEDNALVIIDFDKAISQGYVKLNEQLSNIFDMEGRDE